jgi:non-heme chloroperoxidase
MSDYPPAIGEAADRWAEAFEQAGYAPLTPGWPDDPNTVEEARENPEAFANKSVGQVADHFCDVIKTLDKKTGRRRALLRWAAHPDHRRPGPVRRLGGNRHRAVPLTYDQFRYGFANAVSEDEARQLYDT